LIQLFVIRDDVIGDDLKMGDICTCTEEMWNSYHLSVLVKKPNGYEFWYNKCMFKTIEDIRNDKLKDIGV
jgi:hypothetical protein